MPATHVGNEGRRLLSSLAAAATPSLPALRAHACRGFPVGMAQCRQARYGADGRK